MHLTLYSSDKLPPSLFKQVSPSHFYRSQKLSVFNRKFRPSVVQRQLFLCTCNYSYPTRGSGKYIYLTFTGKWAVIRFVTCFLLCLSSRLVFDYHLLLNFIFLLLIYTHRMCMFVIIQKSFYLCQCQCWWWQKNICMQKFFKLTPVMISEARPIWIAYQIFYKKTLELKTDCLIDRRNVC